LEDLEIFPPVMVMNYLLAGTKPLGDIPGYYLHTSITQVKTANQFTLKDMMERFAGKGDDMITL